MREIKFRGKDALSGIWHYGYLVQSQIFIDDKLKMKIQRQNTSASYFVDEKTIGQFTGLRDKNGKEIYEADIVRGKDYTGLKREGIIAYDNYGAKYIITPNTKSQYREHDTIEDLCPADEYLEVIGNIWDNPELLEEKC